MRFGWNFVKVLPVPAPLVITQGDPAGVGPELALKVLAKIAFAGSREIKAIACRDHLGKLANDLEIPFREEDVIDLPIPSGSVQIGEVSAEAGRHSFDCLEAAVEGALKGDFSAVVTNPINKEAWHLGGLSYPGHTEYLVEKTRATSHAMMLTSEEITCSLITTHVALAEVPGLLRQDRILEVIDLTNRTMSAIHRRPAKLAMPGLNPHAGENGLFGSEELELIIPTLEEARSQGIEIAGPLSPDTAFLPAIRSEIDAYVCLYHDQGLIPLKTLAFDLGVNVTLGLPIIRTSVDHGTAFDLAGKGIASETSLMEAINFARRLLG